MHFSNAVIKATFVICLCCTVVLSVLSVMLSTLHYKEEEEGTKAETEDKKIIDPNGVEMFVVATKHIIE